jgi:Lar family restriction alleviation protein
MSEQALLPCPFCGGVEHEIGYDSAGYDVQCHSWTCRAKTGSHATEAEAVAAWNRRAALPVSREAVTPGVEKQLSAAIFDPGAEVGMKHDRSLTSWQTDAVMNVLTRLVLDELDASKARIAEGWQPIETAPKNGDIVDLFVSGARRTDCRWNIAGHFWERFPSGQFAFGEDEEPTHWRAPPPHPQTGVKHLPLLQRIARERP